MEDQGFERSVNVVRLGEAVSLLRFVYYTMVNGIIACDRKCILTGAVGPYEERPRRLPVQQPFGFEAGTLLVGPPQRFVLVRQFFFRGLLFVAFAHQNTYLIVSYAPHLEPTEIENRTF